MYTAIRMEVDGSARPALGEYDVDLRNNIIDGAVYGIMANIPGKGAYLLDAQQPILNVRRIGLWLDRDAVQIAAPGTAPIRVLLRGTARAATGQTKATDQQYGVFGDYSQYNTPYQIIGNGGTDTVANKAQTGVYFSNASRSFSQCAFSNLTTGIRLRGGSGDVAANTFNNCGAGVRVRANATLAPNFNLWCNSFNNTANIANVRAIWLESGARLNPANRIAYPGEDLPFNAPSQPAGNRFVNYANGNKPFVFNGNTLAVLKYTRFDFSVDEPTGMGINTSTGTLQIISNSSVTIKPGNNCATRIQPTAGAQQRGSALSTAADELRIQALMDTLRRQAAPPQRLGYYQNEIRAYFFAQSRQADLEAYVLTLAGPNSAAYFALGMEVLGYYRRERQPADAARLRQSLGTHPLLDTDAALRARLAYYDVVGRLAAARLGPDARPAPADSLALRQLLTGGQAEALEAAQWWAFYYPTAASPAPTVRMTATPNPLPRSAGGGAAFALFPNPAHRALTVRYAPAGTQLAKGSAPAEVRLVELLGGAVRQRTALVGETTAVPLVGLKPGTYACQLYVGGVWQSSQRVVIE